MLFAGFEPLIFGLVKNSQIKRVFFENFWNIWGLRIDQRLVKDTLTTKITTRVSLMISGRSGDEVNDC